MSQQMQESESGHGQSPDLEYEKAAETLKSLEIP